MRWQWFIEALGYSVGVTESWSDGDADLLVALHAYRSHQSIVEFKEKYPSRPIVLILTGTDIYRDMASHGEVLRSMEMADKLIVLQSSALDSIPSGLRYKAKVIYQSIEIDLPDPVLSEDFLVTIIGHLREEKDPFCLARSLPLLPSESKIHVRHLGKSLNAQMEALAKNFNTTLERYQWVGELSHADTLKMLSQSRLMVISSSMEGGAHVVSEAIALGIPVIASDIPGNRGLLGEDYPGYYPVGDESALASLLSRSETVPDFYSLLKKQIVLRQELIKPAREKQSIQEILSELLRD